MSMLPDDVLVYIFKFYLDQPWKIDAWHTLVHVCQRWRYVVFASPQYLNLRLLCTPRRPMMVALNIWPLAALPLVIEFVAEEKQPPARGMGNMANITVALMQHNRVSQINIRDIPSSLLGIFASMNKPFTALAELEIVSCDKVAPVVPDSFLGGSAPCLRSLRLAGIAFPALPKLLSSTSDLVDLGLWNIPNSGYVSPETMVACLSASTKLNRLCLCFQFPRSRDDQASRHAPSRTRIVLPALTTLDFKGDSMYLENILSRIDAPLLGSVKITFFNQPAFDTPLLRHLISHIEASMAVNRANIDFSAFGVEVTFFQQQGTLDSKTLKLGVACKPSDWQLSAVAQLCISSIPPMPTLEQLTINGDRVQLWRDDIGAPQWLELLHPFSSVKYLVLSRKLVRFVIPALEELTGNGVIELLPMLQHLSLEDSWLSEAVRKGVKEFISARQRFNRPVTVNAAELGPITDGDLMFDECELFGNSFRPSTIMTCTNPLR